MAKVNPAKWLLFIDTNIFLDFYRSSNEANIRLLQRVDPLHAQIIVSRQVEMEFKKNRQKLIVNSLDEMKSPQGFQSFPAFLNDAKSVEVIDRMKNDLDQRVRALKKRSMEMLANPTTKDDAYKIVQRLFANTGTGLNLQEDAEIYGQIAERARSRYLLGYPPRKANDTSCGDAINWEWLVECCQKTGKHVAIVSRDGDYGVIDKSGCFVNDWLKQEFRSRTSPGRQIALVGKLSVALKQYADITVTKDEVEAEKVQIADAKETTHLRRVLTPEAMPCLSDATIGTAVELWSDVALRRWLESPVSEQEQ